MGRVISTMHPANRHMDGLLAVRPADTS